MVDPVHKLLALLAERRDHLRHFSKDKPGWKFAALCVIRLPMAMAFVIIGYWETHH